MSDEHHRLLTKGRISGKLVYTSVNDNGGGLMIYVRDDIPSKMLTKHNLPEDIQTGFIELNFCICKWLLCATYRAPSQNHDYFSDNIDKCLDVYSTYERIALAGDFNAQVCEKLILFYTKKNLLP